jgi:hypothetical protein
MQLWMLTQLTQQWKEFSRRVQDISIADQLYEP